MVFEDEDGLLRVCEFGGTLLKEGGLCLWNWNAWYILLFESYGVVNTGLFDDLLGRMFYAHGTVSVDGMGWDD